MWHDFQKFIPKAAGKYNFAKTLHAIKICQEYRRIAGKILPKEALNNTFAKFDKETLTLSALNSAWAQELQMNKHRIHKSLQEKFGKNTVQKVKIKIAEKMPKEELSK